MRQVLAAVDLVLAEDTRVVGTLLKAFDIVGAKMSFHQHNAAQRIPGLIERLKAGATIALVSDRGTPAISDPGRELVAACHDAGLPVRVVPGPSALTTAFAGSGFPHPFVFWGFLPRSGKTRRETLRRVEETDCTQVFYEAPHRLKDTLAALREALGRDRRIVVARELTKPYEEFWPGTLAQAEAAAERFRGEIVLVVGPPETPRERAHRQPSAALMAALAVLVEEAVQDGLAENEAIRRVAQQFGLARRILYQALKGGGSD